MLTILIAFLLASAVTSRLINFDSNREVQYDDESNENYLDLSANDNIWLEMENKIQNLLPLDMLTNLENSLNAREAQVGSKQCVEKKSKLHSTMRDERYEYYPQYYYNTSCALAQPSDLHNHHRYCESNWEHKCIPIIADIQVFKKPKHQHDCWTAETIKVEAGCKCSLT